MNEAPKAANRHTLQQSLVNVLESIADDIVFLTEGLEKALNEEGNYIGRNTEMSKLGGCGISSFT